MINTNNNRLFNKDFRRRIALFCALLMTMNLITNTAAPLVSFADTDSDSDYNVSEDFGESENEDNSENDENQEASGEENSDNSDASGSDENNDDSGNEKSEENEDNSGNGSESSDNVDDANNNSGDAGNQSDGEVEAEENNSSTENESEDKTENIISQDGEAVAPENEAAENEIETTETEESTGISVANTEVTVQQTGTITEIPEVTGNKVEDAAAAVVETKKEPGPDRYAIEFTEESDNGMTVTVKLKDELKDDREVVFDELVISEDDEDDAEDAISKIRYDILNKLFSKNLKTDKDKDTFETSFYRLKVVDEDGKDLKNVNLNGVIEITSETGCEIAAAAASTAKNKKSDIKKTGEVDGTYKFSLNTKGELIFGVAYCGKVLETWNRDGASIKLGVPVTDKENESIDKKLVKIEDADTDAEVPWLINEGTYKVSVVEEEDIATPSELERTSEPDQPSESEDSLESETSSESEDSLESEMSSESEETLESENSSEPDSSSESEDSLESAMSSESEETLESENSSESDNFSEPDLSSESEPGPYSESPDEDETEGIMWFKVSDKLNKKYNVVINDEEVEFGDNDCLRIETNDSFDIVFDTGLRETECSNGIVDIKGLLPIGHYVDYMDETDSIDSSVFDIQEKTDDTNEGYIRQEFLDISVLTAFTILDVEESESDSELDSDSESEFYAENNLESMFEADPKLDPESGAGSSEDMPNNDISFSIGLSDEFTEGAVDIYRLEGESLEKIKITEDDIVYADNLSIGTYVVTSKTKKVRYICSDDESYEITISYDELSGIPDDAVPSIRELKEKDPEYKEYIDKATEAFNSKKSIKNTARVYDIALVDPETNTEYETDRPVEIDIKLSGRRQGSSCTDLNVVYFTADEENEIVMPDMSSDTDSDSAGFMTESLPVHAVVWYTRNQILTATDGKSYEITVEYDSNTGIPEDAVLEVTELKENDPNFDGYVSQANEILGKDKRKLLFARPFDIKLVDPDNGEKYEPDENVKVSMKLLTEEVEKAEELSVVHFKDTRKERRSRAARKSQEKIENQETMSGEIVEAEVVDGSVEFETGSFSVFVFTGYTVDFHWGEYTYNLAGGNDIYLSELLGIVGTSIAESMPEDSAELLALAKDMSQIENVTFSDPELLKFEKQSSEQTENDWLLTSLAAFDTEEKLTITLTNGEEIVVRVTDAINAGDVCKIGDTGYATLEDAIKAAPTGESTIKLLTDIEIGKTIVLYGSNGNATNNRVDAKNKTITITTAAEYSGSGSTATIYRKDEFANDSLLKIDESTTTLNLTDIVFDGKNIQVTASGTLLSVKDGSLVLDDGAVIRNGYATNMGGGICVDGPKATAILTMKDGCLIEGCTAERGTYYAGGGVAINDGTFVMEGGTVRDCHAPNSAGGAIAIGHGDSNHISATIIGGLITQCTSKEGGAAIELHSAAGLTMTGGTITGNHGGTSGAVNFYHGTEGPLYLSGSPRIYGNTKTKNGVTSASDVCMKYNAVTNIVMAGTLNDDAIIGVDNEGTTDLDSNRQFGQFNTKDGSGKYVIPEGAGVFFFDGKPEYTGVCFQYNGSNTNANYQRLVWVHGIFVEAEFYVKGHSEQTYTIAGSRSAFNFGVPDDMGSETIVAKDTFAERYRKHQGYDDLIDPELTYKTLYVKGHPEWDIRHVCSWRKNSAGQVQFQILGNGVEHQILEDNETIVIQYEIDPQVKITDDEGNILYTAPGNPALYDSLGNAFQGIGTLYTSNTADTKYTAKAHSVKMLKSAYSVLSSVSTSGDYNVTLTTAGADDTDFPGPGGTSVIKNQNVTGQSMITTALKNLTLDQITLDGQNVTTSANGAIVNVGSGTLTISDGATLKNGNTSGKGGAVYAASGASVSVTDGRVTGNTARNGSAIYLDGSAKGTFSGGSITGNKASSGGAVEAGSDSARMNFTGNVQIINNTAKNGSEKRNVCLAQDSNAVIQAVNLGSGANIGVYVPGADNDGETSQYDKHGDEFMPFATYDDTSKANLDRFVNDRNGIKGTDGSRPIEVQGKISVWGKLFPINVVTKTYEIGDFEHATQVYIGTFTPQYAGDIGIQYNVPHGKENVQTGYVYGTAQIGQDKDVESINVNGTYKLKDGTVKKLGSNSTLTVYYFTTPITVPVYWVKENAAGVLTELTDDEAKWWGDNRKTTVPSVKIFETYNIVLSSSEGVTFWTPYTLPKVSNDYDGMPLTKFGFGREGLFGKNSSELQGVITETSQSIYIRNTVNGIVASDKEDLSGGTTYTGKNLAIYIIYQEADYICKIGTERFKTLRAAVKYATDHSLKNAKIEMLVDYTMPAEDTVTIPTEYNITITTADKTGNAGYIYTGAGDKATITRGFTPASAEDTNNNQLFTVTGYRAILTFTNIIIDGDKANHSGGKGSLVYVNGTGGETNVPALVIGTGATLQNAKSSGSTGGGAVYVTHGTVTVAAGGSIQNCVADNSNGGAIYAENTGAVINISGSLTGNSAVDGGAIKASKGVLIYIYPGATLSGNTASQNGGAIYTSGSVNMTGGSIDNNTATEKGAGIYADKNGSISFSGSPVVYDNKVDGKQRNAEFSGNNNTSINVLSALGDSAKIGVYAPGGHNKAGEPFGTRNNVTANLYKFINDQHPELYAVKVDGDDLLYWSYFVARVSNNGGTNWTYHEYLISNETDTQNGQTILKGAFNQANSLAGDVVIETLRETAEINGQDRYTLAGSFEFNNSERITLRTTQDTTWNSSKFTSTIKRGFNGGSMVSFKKENSSVTIEKIILDGDKENYSCDSDGGLVFAQNLTLHMTTGAVLRNSKTTGHGGAIAINGGTINITNTEFYGTSAEQNGGAVYANADATELINVNIDGHTSGGLDSGQTNAYMGAAVYATGNMTIKTQDIYKLDEEGKQLVDGSGKPIVETVGSSTITGCSASGAGIGGAINMDQGKILTLEGNIVIYDNKSTKTNVFTQSSESVQANVVLSENSYDLIQTGTQGLGPNAKVGVYVTGSDITVEPYKSCGSVHDDFGKHAANTNSTLNLDKFINDRNGLKGEKCTDKDHEYRIRWGSALCKLTDSQGYLLFKTEDGMTRPAVYHSFKDALEGVDVEGRLYDYRNNTSYSVDRNIRLEMLKDYKQKSDDRIEYHTAREILFTTSKSGERMNPGYEDCGDDFVYISDSKPATETAVIERGEKKEGHPDASMIKLEIGCGKVTIEKLTFDGNNEAFDGDGAIVHIGASTLVLGDKAILRNGKTSGNGGAVYINSQGTLIIQGGEINNNTVTGSGLGAGVYVAEGATLKLDGNVNFGGSGVDKGNIVYTTGNIADRSLPNDATNGGKEYSKERQDIYIAEYRDDEPASLIVTAKVPSDIEGGSIWVYADSDKHYKKTKPFAVIEPADLELNENVYKAFRNARLDSETECDGEYLSGSSGENAKLIYWSANAVDVYFKKIDGYGEMLEGDELTGSVFTLYTSADCSEADEYKQNGEAKLSEKVTEQEVIDEGKFNLVFKGVPDGTYYMKETTIPDRFRDSGKVYVVCVGSTALAGFGKAGVLADITENDITARTVKGETKYDYAIFCLDDSKEKAKAIPDISTYGVINISKEDDKVIMKKTDQSYTPLEGAEFDILSYDMSPVVKGAASHETGIFWIGKLPYGKYYIKETKSPGGTPRSTTDPDFTLIYDKAAKCFKVGDYPPTTYPNT